MQTFAKRIGAFLLEEGLLQSAQLEQAISLQEQRGGKIGEILIGMGCLSEETYQQSLAYLYNLPFYDKDQLLELTPDEHLLELIPYQAALNYPVLPFRQHHEQQSIEIIALGPLKNSEQDFLLQKTGSGTIRYGLSTTEALHQAIRSHYGKRLWRIAKESTETEAYQSDTSSQHSFIALRKEGFCHSC